MRKLFSLLVTLCLVLSLLPLSSAPVFANATFRDVPATSQYYEAVEFLAAKHIITTATGTYNPQNNLTRGQLAKMMALMLDLDLTNPVNPNFKDVKKTDHYYPYIAALSQAAIISGYPDGRYGVNDSVKRSHMAKFIANSFELPNRELVDNYFSDIKKSSETYDFASRLKFYDITVVDDFKPNSFVTRGQVALFIKRADDAEQRIRVEADLFFDEVNITKALSKTMVARNAAVVDVKADGKNETLVLTPKAIGKTYIYSTAPNSGAKAILVDVDNSGMLTAEVVNALPEMEDEPFTLVEPPLPPDVPNVTIPINPEIIPLLTKKPYTITRDYEMKSVAAKIVDGTLQAALVLNGPFANGYTITPQAADQILRVIITKLDLSTETLYFYSVSKNRELYYIPMKAGYPNEAFFVDLNERYIARSDFELRKDGQLANETDYTLQWGPMVNALESLEKIRFHQPGIYTTYHPDHQYTRTFYVKKVNDTFYAAIEDVWD